MPNILKCGTDPFSLIEELRRAVRGADPKLVEQRLPQDLGERRPTKEETDKFIQMITRGAGVVLKQGKVIGSALIANGVFFAVCGVFGFLGGWLGRKMMWVSQQTVKGQKRLVQFWRTLTIGFIIFVLPLILIPQSLFLSHLWLYAVL